MVVIGAQWDSELQLQKEEKERKRLRAQAVDGRRRASAAAKEVVTSAAKRDLPINNVGLSDHLYVPLPEETRAKVRPKSAGNAGSRHRLASNGNRDNGFGEWPDGYGGYLVGPSEAPIERSTMHSEFGSACPKGPSSPGRGVSTRPKHANGGKIDERMSYTNQRDRASAGSKPPPPTENRPKSAGPVGASGRRQATRKAQHSDDVAHSTFDGSCNNHLPSQDAVSHGYSESLWTAKAGATTTEFSAEVLSQIEEELTNVDPTDLRRPSNFNRSTELDSDSEDDLEAAMAKWMRKQEVKASRGQTSSRLHVTEDLSSERSSRAASKSMTSASRNQSASRFNFDEGGGNRSTGPFRGASEAIDVVTNGYSSHIVSGVKIPVASLLQKQFASISELQEERERRQYQIDNGFTAAYSEAARAAEERTRHALYQGVPEDQFQTYLYDRRIDDSLLGETASTFGGPSNNKGSSSRPPPPMRLPLKENRPKMGPVTQHERMHSQQAAAIFQEVDVEIFGTLPPRYGEMVQSGRSSYFEQDMSAELTLNDAHFDVSSDPLQSSVQKLRSAYSGLTWDF